MIEQITKLEEEIKNHINKKEFNYYALAPEQFGLRHPKDTPFLNMTKGIIIASHNLEFPFINTAETNNGTGYAEQFNSNYGEQYTPNKENYSKYIFLIGCKDYNREGEMDKALLKHAKKIAAFKIN